MKQLKIWVTDKEYAAIMLKINRLKNKNPNRKIKFNISVKLGEKEETPRGVYIPV